MNILISPKWSWLSKSQFENHENVNSKAISDSGFECLQAIKRKEYENLTDKCIFSTSQIKNELKYMLYYRESILVITLNIYNQHIFRIHQ